MTNKLFVLLTVAFLGAHCFAEGVELASKFEGDQGGKHFRPGGGCRLGLSEEQEAKMRSEKFKFQEERIDLEAALKHSRLAYRQVLSDPKADYSAAKGAAKEVANNLVKLLSAKENLKAEVAFKILNADQRKMAEKCHMGHGMRRPQFGGEKEHRWGMEEMDEAPVASAPEHEDMMIVDNEE
jgi:Spy/CpxP family protein refolding chaperone